jgi:hypothetical protein
MFWNSFTINDKRAAMIIWLYGKERIREDAGCCLVLLQFSPLHSEMVRFAARVMQRTDLPEETRPNPTMDPTKGERHRRVPLHGDCGYARVHFTPLSFSIF